MAEEPQPDLPSDMTRLVMTVVGGLCIVLMAVAFSRKRRVQQNESLHQRLEQELIRKSLANEKLLQYTAQLEEELRQARELPATRNLVVEAHHLQTHPATSHSETSIHRDANPSSVFDEERELLIAQWTRRVREAEENGMKRYISLQSALEDEISHLQLELEHAHDRETMSRQSVSEKTREVSRLEELVRQRDEEVSALESQVQELQARSQPQTPNTKEQRYRDQVVELQKEISSLKELLLQERSHSRDSIHDLLKEVDESATSAPPAPSPFRYSSARIRRSQMGSSPSESEQEDSSEPSDLRSNSVPQSIAESVSTEDSTSEDEAVPQIPDDQDTDEQTFEEPPPPFESTPETCPYGTPPAVPSRDLPEHQLTTVESPAPETTLKVPVRDHPHVTKINSSELQKEIEEKRADLLKHREAVVKELFETEKTYLQVLTILVEDLQRPLEESVQIGRPIISESDIRSVFSSVGVIRNYNKYFLERLAPRVAGWEEHQQIGDVLLELSLWLKSYGSYINNYEHANETYTYLQRKNPDFAKFVRKVLRSHRYRDDLSSLLIAPVQRLPRYVLMLKDLVKSTYPDHQDYDDLQKALERVEKITEDINSSKAKFQGSERLLDVANRFDEEYHSQIVAPYRTFVRDVWMFSSVVDLVDPAEISLEEIFVVILLSDLLLVAQPKSHPFLEADSYHRPVHKSKKVLSTISRHVSILDLGEEHDLQMIKAHPLYQLHVSILPSTECGVQITVENSTAKYMLFTQSNELRDLFVKDFASCYQTLQQQNPEASEESAKNLNSPTSDHSRSGSFRKRDFLRRLATHQRFL